MISQFWSHNVAKVILIVASAHLCLACTARKPPPPIPVFPPTSPDSVQQLRYPPSAPYDLLEIITIEAETGNQYANALREARQSAAAKGANAMLLVQNQEFRQKINRHDRTIRRTIFRAIHFKKQA